MQGTFLTGSKTGTFPRTSKQGSLQLKQSTAFSFLASTFSKEIKLQPYASY